jgi:hypothetical protein
MCKHYTPPQKPFNATSASRRENVHIKTRLGKLAQMRGAPTQTAQNSNRAGSVNQEPGAAREFQFPEYIDSGICIKRCPPRKGTSRAA